ncbi:hypothetical protein pdam_00014866 [Pocillopora damicornis]|uniref:CUB domain-containing protein n=1 Tax=Pocillopora damicornis TaxID=46731 RepID=A0A3M6THS0_POCDA|nr:hypothetical protein pdam_00014866 [Pocillopora damicornis]
MVQVDICNMNRIFLQTITVFLGMDVGLVESLFCDGNYTSSNGTVSSPSFSSRSTYKNSLDCTYDIEVGGEYGIKLLWSAFDVRGEMPNCFEDSVEIFLGCVSRHSIGKYCSENGYKPFDVYSSENCLRLVFKTDTSGGGKGFQASYSSFLLNGRQSGVGGECSSTKTLTATSGVISSPNWPQDYPNYRDCYWNIEVGNKRSIKIAFMDFHLEYDFLYGDDHESYDKSDTLKESNCGEQDPFYLMSSKERIWIRFKSDRFTNHRGFVAGYVMYDKTSVSAKTVGIVIGVLVAVVVLIAIGVFVFYKYVHQKRVRARAPQQMAVAYTTAQPQQVAMYPPSAGPQQGYAPPPYNQGAAAPYPTQEKSGAYPPSRQPYPLEPLGGEAAYLPGQPGGAPPYPTGQPGGVPPYPPHVTIVDSFWKFFCSY